MGRRRKVKPVIAEQTVEEEIHVPTKRDEALIEMQSQLEEMKLQLQKEKEEITKLAKVQRNQEIGRQKYGEGEWQKWESGSERGYYRSIYIDIKPMINPTRMM